MGNIVELNRDYIKGIHSAKMQIATGDIYNLEGALYMFQLDPANTEFQRGFHAGLIQVYRQKNGGLR
jgi:hypothetical protein